MRGERRPSATIRLETMRHALLPIGSYMWEFFCSRAKAIAASQITDVSDGRGRHDDWLLLVLRTDPASDRYIAGAPYPDLDVAGLSASFDKAILSMPLSFQLDGSCVASADLPPRSA